MTRTKNDSKNQAEPPSTRWWESYLVRYFVGFIVGGICVSTIIYQTDLLHNLTETFFASQAEKKPDWTALIIALSFLGIMYCYLASSPITVLHAGRYGQGVIDAHSRHFWLGWLIAGVLMLLNIYHVKLLSILALLVIAGVLIIAIWWFPVSKSFDGARLPSNWNKDREFRNFWKSKPLILLIVQTLFWAILILALFSIFIYCLEKIIGSNKPLAISTIKLWLLSLPVVWIGLTQYFVLERLLREDNQFTDFYTKLFRARRMLNAKDVRDSYTHLREHSNSVFIVVVELSILALVMAFFRTAKDFSLENGFDESLVWVLFGLAFWMIPTVFMWGRANSMERDFAGNPNKFIK